MSILEVGDRLINLDQVAWVHLRHRDHDGTAVVQVVFVPGNWVTLRGGRDEEFRAAPLVALWSGSSSVIGVGDFLINPDAVTLIELDPPRVFGGGPEGTRAAIQLVVGPGSVSAANTGGLPGSTVSLSLYDDDAFEFLRKYGDLKSFQLRYQFGD